MPVYVRVLDKDTGTEQSVFESQVSLGNYEVLKDQPAVDDRTELPLPPEFGAPKSLSSNTNSGQLADPKKENAHG